MLGILFFSALWGASEAGLGGVLYRAHIPHSSVPLTIIAFVILSIARVYFPQKGSSTLIGSVAMLYKFLNTPFFGCHLLAIFLLGVSYDLVFSLFKLTQAKACGYQELSEAKARDYKVAAPLRLHEKVAATLRARALQGEAFRLHEKGSSCWVNIRNKALFGLVTTYVGYILFALTITYVFRYHHWVEEGIPRIVRYVGISGTMASLGNAIFVPISLHLGQILKKKVTNPFEFSELWVWICRGSIYRTRDNGRHKCRPYNYLKSGLLTGGICLITLGLWILGVMRYLGVRQYF